MSVTTTTVETVSSDDGVRRRLASTFSDGPPPKSLRSEFVSGFRTPQASSTHVGRMRRTPVQRFVRWATKPTNHYVWLFLIILGVVASWVGYAMDQAARLRPVRLTGADNIAAAQRQAVTAESGNELRR